MFYNLFMINTFKETIILSITFTLSSIMVNLIINKSLDEILSLVLPLDIPERLIIMSDVQTKVPLVLLRKVYERLRMHDIRQQIEALTYLFGVVHIGRLIARLSVDAPVDGPRIDLFEVQNLLRGRRQDRLLVRVINICYVRVDVSLSLTCFQDEVFVTI